MLIAFTLCFLRDPGRTLAEANRLLAAGGGLVVGFLPRGTPWADAYAARGRQGHPIYRHARFYTVTDVERLLARAGLQVFGQRSTLRQPPGVDRYRVEAPSDHVAPGAGFCAISATRAEVAPPTA